MTPEPISLPGLPGEQLVWPDAETAAARLADLLVEHLRDRLRILAHAHLALSGGGAGRLLATALGRRNDVRADEWARIHVWMVDERWVPTQDPQSNFGMIRTEMAQRLPIPGENLHPMPVLHPDAAQRYEDALRWELIGRAEPERRLDAVVLGIGPDGHTASLFPASPALEERQRWITLNDGEQVTPPRPRLTMTYPLINQACLVAVLVVASAKRAALQRAAGGHESYQTLPIAGVTPGPGSRFLWVLDRAAVGG
jgi:6-phosphogluconolactonase